MSRPELVAAPADADSAAGDASWFAAVTGADVSAADAATDCCCATDIGAVATVAIGAFTPLDVAGAGESDASVGSVRDVADASSGLAALAASMMAP
jgi:hypothetical protein